MPLHLTLIEGLWLFADGIILCLGWAVGNGILWLMRFILGRVNPNPPPSQ